MERKQRVGASPPKPPTEKTTSLRLIPPAGGENGRAKRGVCARGGNGGASEELRKLIADIIYAADWEIGGTLNAWDRDITEFYMINEKEIVETIIKALREASGR